MSYAFGPGAGGERLTFHWFLPTSGDGRSIVGRGHAIPTAGDAERPADLEYLAQVAKAAEQLGFEAVLTPTGTWCEDAWLTTAALIPHTTRLKFLVAFRPGRVSPTLAAQKILGATESAGQDRMRALHASYRNAGRAADLEVYPHLWAGVGLVRGGAGTALVGSHGQVADLIEEYAALGISEFILSGHPHLEEAYWFGEGVLPELRRRGRWAPPGSLIPAAGDVKHGPFGKNVFMSVLDGKVALVTGASRGIGAEIARRFGAAGAAVAVAARTTEGTAAAFPGTIDQTVAEISGAGGTAVAIAADLSRPDDRVRLVQETTARLGPPDILVSNAAVTYFGPVAEFTAKRYALMFAVQVEAPFHLATLVLPGMRARGTGWILNISSVAARHPALTNRRLGGTVYGMCKAALERFSTGLAAELYDDNIAVNALSPTRVVPTPGTIFHHLTSLDDPAAEPPAVMAEAALLLCHREPRTLTGRVAYSQELLAEFGVPVPRVT